MNPLHRCLFSFNAINGFSHLLILLVCVYILENVASWLDAMMPIWIKSLPFPAPASPLCSWLGLMNCCHPFSFSTLIVFCVSLCGLIPDTFWTHSYLPSSVVEMLLRYFCFVALVWWRIHKILREWFTPCLVNLDSTYLLLYLINVCFIFCALLLH